MNKPVIDISFEGVCYGKIEDTGFKLEGIGSEEIKRILDNKTYKTNLLEKFLLSFKPDELYVNRAVHQGKKNIESDKALYDFALGRYDGAVGVVSQKGFEISRKELLKEKQKKKGRRYRVDVSEEENTVFRFNIKLVITTKFDKRKDKPYFLSTLLLRNDMKFNENCVPSNNEDVFEYLLVLYYKQSLKKALIKGFYKTYRNFENNDSKIKGSIDVNKFIKNNIWIDDGKMPYKYRENSYCNPLNQLILVTYDELKKRYAGIVRLNIDNNHEIHKALEMLRGINGKYGNDVIQKNRKMITHPYYHEYEDLRRICLIILNGNGISLWDANDNETIQGFLFYIPDYWEMFLEECFSNRLEKEDIKAIPQGGKKGIRILSKTKKEKIYCLQTYPDFVFEKSMEDSKKEKNKGNKKTKKLCILDAKFKDGWDAVFFKRRIPSGKILDDYTKCIRDMNTINASYTGVIYPTKNPYPVIEEGNAYFADNATDRKISEYNKRDTFWIFPISVPEVVDEVSFKEWREAFNKNVDLAMGTIISKIKSI